VLRLPPHVHVRGQGRRSAATYKISHWLTTGSEDPTTGAAAKQQHPIIAQDHDMHSVCQQLTLGRLVFDAIHPILNLDASAERTATKQAAELNDSVQCLNAPASLYIQS
jgi:hypothetical protein